MSMRSVGIIYDGSSPKPRLFRALYMANTKVTKVLDLSSNPNQARNVDELVHVTGLDEKHRFVELKAMLDSNPKVSHVLVDMSTAQIPIFNLMADVLSRGINLCIQQPCLPFSKLSIPQLTRLFAIAETNNCMLLALSRFLFSKAFAELLQLTTHPHFGTVIDVLLRFGCGTLPTPESDAREFMISRSAIPAFQMVCALIEGLPKQITILEQHNTNRPFACGVILQFEDALATLHLSSARSWGIPYHRLEAGLVGGVFTTNFFHYQKISKGAKGITSPLFNDDDTSQAIYGSAGKLNAFFTDDSELKELNNQSYEIVVRNFALRDTLLELLKNKESMTTDKKIARQQKRLMKAEPSIDHDIIALVHKGDLYQARNRAMEDVNAFVETS